MTTIHDVKVEPEPTPPPVPTAIIPAEAETQPKNPYYGLSAEAFPKSTVAALVAPIDENDVEIRPDGLIFMPEIKYRRILNKAFGPGGWGVHPRGTELHGKVMCYKGALFASGRFVAESIGEQEYFESNKGMSYATAAESAKSNCLMRCCKDLGISSELWDPRFIRAWKEKYAVEIWCENISKGEDAGKKKLLWRRKDDKAIGYPWKESGASVARKKDGEASPSNAGGATEGHHVPAAERNSSVGSDSNPKQSVRVDANKGSARGTLSVAPPTAQEEVGQSPKMTKDTLAAIKSLISKIGLTKQDTQPHIKARFACTTSELTEANALEFLRDLDAVNVGRKELAYHVDGLMYFKERT